MVRLANRRFIPFFFDLDTSGAVGDADARAFVVKARPEYGGMGVGTPPVFFMTADGEIVGEVDNYARASRVFAAMKKLLKEKPEFAKETETEAKLTGLERAEYLFDLGDDAGAREVLSRLEGPAAAYLRGRVARFARDWEEMERCFEAAKDERLAGDVRMERAHRNWHEKDYEALLKATSDFPKESRRYTEARYYEGLAHFHLDRKDRAMEIWKETIGSRPQDAWIYRADWAWYNARHGSPSEFMGGRKASPLGRIGYMGNRNPDLERR